MRSDPGTARRRGQALRHCSGQAIVEYIILFPVLLLLVLGTVQIALIYQAKFTLNYAAFMGARQGALKNASMNAIKDGVAAGMAPLFMRYSGTSVPGPGDLLKARMISTIEVFNPMTAKVEIISPTKAAFDVLKGSGSEIPNDNLMYRSGSADGMSIQDANLLKIRVTYCVKLVVPFANRVIYSLAVGIQGVQNLAHEFFWTPTYTPPPSTSILCSEISSLYANARQQIDNAAAASGLPSAATGVISSAANSIFSLLPSSFPTIPFLNWNIGGMRIPVTAEAIVRMQSPVRDGGLP